MLGADFCTHIFSRIIRFPLHPTNRKAERERDGERMGEREQDIFVFGV